MKRTHLAGTAHRRQMLASSLRFSAVCPGARNSSMPSPAFPKTFENRPFFFRLPRACNSSSAVTKTLRENSTSVIFLGFTTNIFIAGFAALAAACAASSALSFQDVFRKVKKAGSLSKLFAKIQA